MTTIVNTPVVFIIFNRPDDAVKVFEQIALAQPRRLFVIADGPRNDDEAARCAATRAIIDRVDWECDVRTNFSDSNMGCRRRIMSGLDWVFDQVDEVIILEDDCVPDQSFFPYCDAMLERYRDDTRFMMVCGTNYLKDKLDIPETYTYSQFFAVWGWATWKRAWKLYDRDMEFWPRYRDSGQLSGIYPSERVCKWLTWMFDHIHQMDSWATPWTYTCMFNNALSIVPRVNLISNIGIEGAHFRAANHEYLSMPTFSLNTTAITHPTQVFPDQRYDGPFFANSTLFTVPSWPLWRRVAGKVKRALMKAAGIRGTAPVK